MHRPSIKKSLDSFIEWNYNSGIYWKKKASYFLKNLIQKWPKSSEQLTKIGRACPQSNHTLAENKTLDSRNLFYIMFILK